MKALVKAHKQQGIWLEDCEKPSFEANEVLIKVRKAAICGTDIHIYQWDEWAQQTIPVPMIVGHEFCGEIIAMGDLVKGFHIGQRVSGEGHIVCGICRNCRAGKRHNCRDVKGVGVNRPGAFAEYLVLPAENVVPLPDDISDDLGAILDPLGNATHCALTYDVVGEDVLITGAGPIGIMAASILKFIGARLTDINEDRLAIVRQMGVATPLNVMHESIADVISRLGMREGFDIGLEMSGNPKALNDMVNHMTNGGRIALLGIPPQSAAIDWNQVIFKGLELKGIYGRQMYETWYKMIAMLQSGLDLSKIITHRFDIADYQQAFDMMSSGRSGKVVLSFV